MATIANGESGLSVRTKLNNVIGNTAIMAIVAGTIVGIDISGNAATATTATTATTASSVPASGLTGTTLAANVVTTSITSTGTMTSGILSTGYVVAGVTMTLGSDATGDVYYRSAGGVLTRLAAGAAGTFFRFAGAATIPTVSTLVLPNAATANRIVYATSTNTYGESANMAYDGTGILLGAPTATGRRLDILQDTATTSIGSLIGATSQCAIYFNQSSPSASNYVLSSSSGGTQLNTPSTTTLMLNVNNATMLSLTNNFALFTPASSSSGAVTNWQYTAPSKTNQTTLTESKDIFFDLSATLQHANGTVALQRSIAINSRTYSFVSGTQTMTDAATMGFSGAPVAGTSASITNSHTILIQSASVAAGTTNSYGITVNAHSGATNNYSAQFVGGDIVHGEGVDFITGTSTGSIIALTTSQKIGFHAATPTIQRAGAAQAAVATTAATNVTPFGYTTAAQADAIVTLVNEMRAWAVEKGFIKGAA